MCTWCKRFRALNLVQHNSAVLQHLSRVPHTNMSVDSPSTFEKSGVQVLTTTPMVPFRLLYDGRPPVDLESPLDFPRERTFADVLEPTVNCTIITPEAYTGAVLQLCSSRRGDLLVCHACARTRLRYRPV